jgi:2-polyprenyl-3-methyl-5-hydroxy-6-metoxy-1,4-benzoquinol methylase
MEKYTQQNTSQNNPKIMAQKLSDVSENQENVRNKEIEKSYGNNYLKWKGWEKESDFGTLKKQEKAYFAAEIRKTHNIFPTNSKVLEIGFGNGSFLKFAKDLNWDIFGTEINEHLIKAALDCGYKVIHSDNLLAYSENTFDLVVGFDVLEHIPQSDLLNFINEVKRILKKGGFFIARFPNGDSPFGLIYQNGDTTHITTIGSGKAYYFAAQCDMDVVFIGGEAQPLLGASLLHFAHRLIALPIKKVLHLITNLIFFPRSNISFYSSNLTIIYKKLN